MITRDFLGTTVGMLGFGAMRLPQLEDGSIDEAQVEVMVDYAYEHGVNYFDTAYPYHNGLSEVVLARALSKYPRDSYCLATKFPGHQIADSYYPADIFEEQLRKCNVEYFDYYLLHNVNESCVDVYLDPQWGIIEYFGEQKRLGRIKYLGFSTHANVGLLESFLDTAGSSMEFCQIQLNWLDWTLQQAKEKVALLNAHGLPIVVMEPLRGGALCNLDGREETLDALRPGKSTVSWSFGFLQGIPGISVILSGMSNMEQLEENIALFEHEETLTGAQIDALFDIAEQMKGGVPCTACGYCTDHCPVGLDIPLLISVFNDLKVSKQIGVSMRLEQLDAQSLPQVCIACGNCAKMCPQNIAIPDVMAKLSSMLAEMPKWADLCKERDAAAAALRKG